MKFARYLIVAALALAAGVAAGWFIWGRTRPIPADAAATRDESLQEMQQGISQLQQQMETILAKPSEPVPWDSLKTTQAKLEKKLDAVAKQSEYQLNLLARLTATEDAKYQRALHAGNALYAEGKLEQAITALNVAVDLRPELFNAYLLRGAAQMELRNWQAAIDDLTAAKQLNPDSPDASNNLAWIRATCPDQKFRDGATAIELATAACEMTEWSNPAQLSTLAASYAEQGDFEAAIEWQKKCVGLAGMEQGEAFRSVLAKYERNEPLRDFGSAARE